jgi:hypothetical protein
MESNTQTFELNPKFVLWKFCAFYAKVTGIYQYNGYHLIMLMTLPWAYDSEKQLIKNRDVFVLWQDIIVAVSQLFCSNICRVTSGVIQWTGTLEFAYVLTPKGPRVFFSENALNLPFLAHEAKMNFFSLFRTFNCRILP